MPSDWNGVMIMRARRVPTLDWPSNLYRDAGSDVQATDTARQSRIYGCAINNRGSGLPGCATVVGDHDLGMTGIDALPEQSASLPQSFLDRRGHALHSVPILAS